MVSSNTITATDAADDVGIMSIESEGQIHPAMMVVKSVDNMLRGAGAKASFVTEVDNDDEALACSNIGGQCTKKSNGTSDCCE